MNKKRTNIKIHRERLDAIGRLLRSYSIQEVKEGLKTWDFWIYDADSLLEDYKHIFNTDKDYLDMETITHHSFNKSGYVYLWLIAKMSELDPVYQENWTELELDATKNPSLFLSELPENMSNLTHLESLTLRDHRLNSLPEFFGNLTKLKTLSLKSCCIQVLPYSFSNLKNLISLNLSKNRLIHIQKGQIPTGKLTHLNLSENRLKRFLPMDYALYLETLDLSYNRLTKLENPQSKTLYGELTSLNISHNKFTKISLDSLPNLENLNASGNLISKLQPTVTYHKKLKILDLSYNKIETLDCHIVKGCLKELNLEGNKIVSISDDIQKFKDLEVLNLGKNHLCYLPTGMGNLKSLTKLNLIGQKEELVKIPASLENLTNLKTLNLSGNYHVFEVDPFHFPVENLENLSLRFVMLDEIPEKFLKAKNLIRLNISNTQYKDLSNFRNCSKLEFLDLTDSKITSPEVLEFFPSLARVKVSRKYLSDFSKAFPNLSFYC